MAQIKFKIRTKRKDIEAPIYVRVYQGRNNESTVRTPFSVHPKYWDAKNQKVKQLNGFDAKDYTKLNEEISSLYSFLVKESNDLSSNGLNIESDWLKGVITSFVTGDDDIKEIMSISNFIDIQVDKMETGKLLIPKGTRYAAGTIKGYKQLKTKLEGFRKKNIPISAIDKDFGEDFLSFLTNQPLSKNYIGKISSRLKSIMNMARKDGYVSNLYYMDFPVFKEKVKNIYLSIEEIERIRKVDLSKDMKLEQIRDIFVFGCYIGQRVSDYNIGKKFQTQIKKTKKGAPITILSIYQKKTGVNALIPLRSEPLEIIEKYNYKLPTQNPQDINDYIKDIGELAGINENVEIKITRGGEVIKKIFPKYELIKTHTARRSMITNMVIDGELSLRQMMLISGHKYERDFNDYIKSGHEEQLDNIVNADFFNN